MTHTVYDPNAKQPIDEATHWSSHAVAQWKEAREMESVIALYFGS